MESREEMGTSVPCLTHTETLITAYQKELTFPLAETKKKKCITRHSYSRKFFKIRKNGLVPQSQHGRLHIEHGTKREQ